MELAIVDDQGSYSIKLIWRKFAQRGRSYFALRAPTDARGCSVDEQTLLSHLDEGRYTEALVVLIDAGWDMNYKQSKSMNMLMSLLQRCEYCYDSKWLSFIETLLKTGAVIKRGFNTVYCWLTQNISVCKKCCGECRMNIYDMILKQSPNIIDELYETDPSDGMDHITRGIVRYGNMHFIHGLIVYKVPIRWNYAPRIMVKFKQQPRETYFKMLLNQFTVNDNDAILCLLKKIILSTDFDADDYGADGYTAAYHIAMANSTLLFKALLERRDADKCMQSLQSQLTYSDVKPSPCIRRLLQDRIKNTSFRDSLNNLKRITNECSCFFDEQRSDMLATLSYFERQSICDYGKSVQPSMSKEHRTLLLENRVDICENLIPSEIFAHLVQDQILNDNMVEEIKKRNHNIQRDMNEDLLRRLPLRGARAFRSFCLALRETQHGFIADMIDGSREHVPERRLHEVDPPRKRRKKD